jgi:nicotinic acid mononucleotide adenylyltransferase
MEVFTHLKNRIYLVFSAVQCSNERRSWMSKLGNQPGVYRLSDGAKPGDGVILIMVGSFAPAHDGHIAAMTAATAAIEAAGQELAGVVYVPNGDSYVSFKIHDTRKVWNFGRRIEVLMELVPSLKVPTFVDDLSGSTPIVDKSITKTAITTASERLGVDPSRFVIVVGSDQAASVEPYMTTNQAVCVVRPGAVAVMLNLLREDWFRRAAASGQYLFTERDNPYEDISSTQIRSAAQSLETDN